MKLAKTFKSKQNEAHKAISNLKQLKKLSQLETQNNHLQKTFNNVTEEEKVGSLMVEKINEHGFPAKEKLDF